MVRQQRNRGTQRRRSSRTAEQRRAILELAEQLGNVSEACRRSGVTRTSFYDWQRRFLAGGLAALEDNDRLPAPHPQTTPDVVAQRILQLARSHPTFGCNRLSRLLSAEGVRVSATTIQKILNRNGLGTREQRQHR